MSSSRHCTLTAHGIINIPPSRPFDILVSNISDRETRLPKRMIVANSLAPPNIIHTIDSTGQKVFPIGTAKVDINLSDELQLNGLPDTAHVSAEH